MRATRALRRRRLSLTRQRAELLPHVQNTHSQDNLAESGKTMASKANRGGVAERFPEPAVQKSIGVDLALRGSYDELLRELEFHPVTAATQARATARYRLRTVPGSGKRLSLVLLYESHDIGRFPRVPAFVSSCRLGTWAKESAGTRSGTSGTKIGHASLTWAFSEAAVLLLRNKPAGQKVLARLEQNHGQGQALTVLAPKLARAVYDMSKRGTAVDLDKFFHD
jgi:transposase